MRPPIAADDGVNVMAHAGEQGLAIGGGAVGPREDPGGSLAVPDQRVADHVHSARFAVGDKPVSGVEREPLGLGMDPFHLSRFSGLMVSKWRDTIASPPWILAVALCLVERRADSNAGGIRVRNGGSPMSMAAGDKAPC